MSKEIHTGYKETRIDRPMEMACDLVSLITQETLGESAPEKTGHPNPDVSVEPRDLMGMCAGLGSMLDHELDGKDDGVDDQQRRHLWALRRLLSCVQRHVYVGVTETAWADDGDE